jgi:hypothetical protein
VKCPTNLKIKDYKKINKKKTILILSKWFYPHFRSFWRRRRLYWWPRKK